MNYDDMPAGPEMDALVAERVMGEIVSSGDKIVPVNGWEACRYIPEYSSRIEAAWEVVEKLIERRLYMRVMACEGIEYSFDMNIKTFWRVELKEGQAIEPHITATSFDTAPLAICRAALKAVDSK